MRQALHLRRGRRNAILSSDELPRRGKRDEFSRADLIDAGLGQMRNASYGRKALLLISDGIDNHSWHTQGDIKSVLKEADAKKGYYGWSE